MSSPSQLPLFGFVNPRATLPAFLVPVFGSDSGLWIQDSQGDGLLSRFLPLQRAHRDDHGGPQA